MRQAAFVLLITISLTYSISHGIGCGFLAEASEVR